MLSSLINLCGILFFGLIAVILIAVIIIFVIEMAKKLAEEMKE